MFSEIFKNLGVVIDCHLTMPAHHILGIVGWARRFDGKICLSKGDFARMFTSILTTTLLGSPS